MEIDILIVNKQTMIKQYTYLPGKIVLSYYNKLF